MAEDVVQHDQHGGSPYLTLGQAAKRCPGRPSTNAVWRWCRRGIKSRSGRRVKLGHVRVGGRIFVTQQSLDQFFKAVAAADAEHFNRSVEIGPPSKRPGSTHRRHLDRQRGRSIARAKAVLDQAGI